MRRRSSPVRAVCALFPIYIGIVALCFARPASAQICEAGQIHVFVKDSQEAPIFKAQVRLVSGSKEIDVRTTESTGSADFGDVPCGPLTVYASKPGFDERSMGVQMTTGFSAEVAVTLEPQVQHSTVEVKETAPPVEQSSSQNNELHPVDLKPLPGNPPTVTETLPLVPGVVRSANGELIINGSGEQRSSLVVNESDVTDPATGKFSETVPLDSIQTINVLTTPFLAQYGRFTQSVVAVETRRGGEKWHADLNDPFPDFRVRSFHLRGIRNETPRAVIGGPLIRQRLYFISAFQYLLDKAPSRTLGFPYNESKQERINSFSQFDYIASSKQILTATLHVAPQHTNFVNTVYFNSHTITPSYAQHNYIGTFADHYGLFGGTLDNSISFQRFIASVGAQGNADYVLTPQGTQGNYFGRQYRAAPRTEWLEIWSPALLHFAGTHQIKLGNSLTDSNNTGRFLFRPVNILNGQGSRIERIQFSSPVVFNKTDLEVTAYAQDHWSLTPKVAVDYGLRIEHQKLASSLRFAPRAGVAWTPFANQQTVFRAGFGQFYDHIPLDVYSFDHYPRRTVIQYAPDGSVLGLPVPFLNVIGSVTGPRSFLVRGQRVAGAFSPRGQTWNVQVEHSFSRLLRVRGVYTDNRSVGLIVLDPELRGTTNEIVLNGDGSSRYRQAELTAKIGWADGQQLVFNYTRSRAEGSLNEFDNFLGNFPTPIIRPDVYSITPADLPNRFLMWGNVATHIWDLKVSPIVEYRNGFPYAQYDAFQNYAGVPYKDDSRFRNFLSADARISKVIQIDPKYGLRLSLTGFNLTNHFNPLAVHNNIADPQQGLFFGNYHRRYRFDFEVLF